MRNDTSGNKQKDDKVFSWRRAEGVAPLDSHIRQRRRVSDMNSYVRWHGYNKYQHAAVPADLFLTIAGHRVTETSSVRDLGVVLDSTLSMQAHVGQVTKSCYYQLRNIGQIRRRINEGACKTLVHALVTSRIDYCNSLLYGLPQTVVQCLQRVQNCAARIVSRTNKYDHITPV